MKQMALFLRGKFLIFGTVLLTILICLVYSSKTGEKKDREKTSIVSVNDDETNRLRQENDELKRTLAEMKRENNAPKAALDKIKQENQELKRALTATISKNKQTAPPYAKSNKKKQTKNIYDPNRVNSLLAQFGSSTNADEKVKLLKSLGEMSLEQNPSVIKIVQDALDDPNSKVGYAAIKLLEGYDTPEILPAIAKALNVKYEETRIEALKHLSGIDDPRVGDLLDQALNNTSEDVRSTAIEMAESQPDTVELGILQKGLTSSYNDVKNEVVHALESRNDHKAVEILIEGLKDTNQNFRNEVNAGLSFLIDKEFKSYEEAKAWWDENKYKYDAELFEIEEKDGGKKQ